MEFNFGIQFESGAGLAGQLSATLDGETPLAGAQEPIINIGSQSIFTKGEFVSPNYVSGSTGWMIDALGNAEFNSGIFRGQLIAGSIDIPSATAANSFHVDSSGNAWWGSVALADYKVKILNTGEIWINNGADINLVEGGDIKYSPVDDPTTTLTAAQSATAGVVTAGDHYYAVSFITASGETDISPVSNTVTADGSHKIDLTSIPISSSTAVTGRRLYRTKAGGAVLYFLQNMGDNTTTTIQDNTQDASLIYLYRSTRGTSAFGSIMFYLSGAYWTILKGFYSSVFLGRGAGLSDTFGTQNTGIGTNTLFSNYSGINNTAVGYQSGVYVKGDSNTSIGSGSMLGSALGMTGASNLAAGYQSLYSLYTGSFNVAIGMSALKSTGIGEYNTALGANSGYTLDSGSYNTFLGYHAGYLCETGISNIFLGYYAGSYETGSGSFYVDNRDRTNTAGDKAGALLYGVFNATPASQTLKTNSTFTVAQNLIVGSGGAGVDYTLTFDGETNDGLLTWMEDENYFKFSDDIMMLGGENIVLDTSTGTKIGTATSQLLGFYNATPVDQPATVADAVTQDVAGINTVDEVKIEADLTSCKNAINAIIDRLQELGLIA